MNQPRSTYKTDYVSFEFNQNGFPSDTENEEFCTSENVDDCLKCISREFCALGIPSFYSTNNSCQYAVNCDIVAFLNGTFELLQKYRSDTNLKEDLEDSNQRLFSDINVLSKKNCQLKESLKQSDNQNKSVLERERQLIEKNNQLLQALKVEKDENKKLSSQMLQQKNAFQHEIRKCESSMNQMRNRLSQIVADKNPEKRVAGITTSGSLQRDSKQRGKWQTGSVAKSSIEEMYNSVISSYENRNSEMLKEIKEYRLVLECILSQIGENIDLLQGSSSNSVDLTSLRAIWNDADRKNSIENIFNSMLNKLRKHVLMKQEQSQDCQNEFSLTVHMCQNAANNCDSEVPIVASEAREASDSCSCATSSNLEERLKQLDVEQKRLSEERMKLSSTASFIEKAKADLELQKLKLVRMALKREMSDSEWPSSVAVVTSREGVVSVPSAEELGRYLSDPDSSEHVKNLTPLWLSDIGEHLPNLNSSSETVLPVLQSKLTSISLDSQYLDDAFESDLPKWAVATQTVPLETANPVACDDVPEDVLEPELPLNSSQPSLDLLRSAMEDIEKRRSDLSTK